MDLKAKIWPGDRDQKIAVVKSGVVFMVLPLVQNEFAASVVPRLPTIIILNELQNLLLNHAAGNLSLPIMMTTILKKGAFAIMSRFKWTRALVKAIIEAWVYLDIQVNQPLMPIFFSKMWRIKRHII